MLRISSSNLSFAVLFFMATFPALLVFFFFLVVEWQSLPSKDGEGKRGGEREMWKERKAHATCVLSVANSFALSCSGNFCPHTHTYKGTHTGTQTDTHIRHLVWLYFCLHIGLSLNSLESLLNDDLCPLSSSSSSSSQF